MRWLVVASVVSLLVAACGGGARPTPAPEATQPAIVTATPEPTLIPSPTPSPSPTPNPADAIRIQTFAPGEPITGMQSGAFVMDTNTGQVTAYQVIDLYEIWGAYAFSPDSRFIYAGHRYLVVRGFGVVAVPPEYRPIVSPGFGPELLSQNGQIAVADADGGILIVDSDFNNPRPLDLPRLSDDARGQIAFVASADLLRAAVQLDGLHIVNFSDASVISVLGAGGALGGALNDGFWTSSADGFEVNVTRFSWLGEPTASLTIALPYPSVFWPAMHVSPDGNIVAVWGQVAPHDWGGEGGAPNPSAVTFYSFDTGEPLFRVLGAVIPTSWQSERTLWVEDGSAIIVSTTDGIFLVNADGTWGRGDLPGRMAIPSPSQSDIFAFVPRGVWNASTGAKHFLDVDISLEPAIRPWGLDSDVVRYAGPPVGRGGGGPQPVARPAVEFPPFAPEELEVVGTGDCLELRVQPSVHAEVADCVPEGARIIIAPVAVEDVMRLGEPLALDGSGEVVSAITNWREECPDEAAYCDWVSVETPSGQTGWVAAEYLRWPGIAPPESH